MSEEDGLRPFGSRRLERWLARIAWLPRPLLLSLRTTFLRRGRLALTVGNLAIGGAVFISALNVAGAWNRSVIENFRVRHYDVTVVLASPQPIDAIAESLAALPSVAHAEYWPQATPYLIGANGVAGRPLTLLGLDPDSELLDLPLQAGRWLRPDDSTGVVINSIVVTRNPTLRVGGTLHLRLEGRTLAFPIVGVAKEMTPAPVVYAPAGAVLDATGQSGDLARTIRIVTREHTDAGQLAAAQDLERMFERLGIEVGGVQRMLDVRKSILDHIVILMVALTMAAAIVVVVGSLGLSSTLTLNVLQRTREIGILGALGATPRTISVHVWFEGVLIGVMSWMLANVLAAPVSYVLQIVTGRMFFKAPLDFFMSLGAAAIWLALVLVLASLSSFYPAWRATRLSVREAISHA